jgi:3-oxoadipate enol-lactonase
MNAVIVVRTAHLATRSVRYLEAGEGRPLVLVHAFPLNAEQWLPQLTRVPRGWRMIAPDLRGFGPAEPEAVVAGGVGMTTYAGDVLELMTHLDISRAAVAGLSMGGYVAFEMLRQAPSRMSGLVLADTRAGADSEDAKAGRDRMMMVLERDGPVGVSREMVPKLLGRTSIEEQPDLAVAVREMIETSTPAGILSGIRAMKDRPDSAALLPGIECPAMVICGAEDSVTPLVEAEGMCSAIPGAQLVIVPAAGHLSNLENPLAFSAAIDEFARRLEAA